MSVFSKMRQAIETGANSAIVKNADKEKLNDIVNSKEIVDRAARMQQARAIEPNVTLMGAVQSAAKDVEYPTEDFVEKYSDTLTGRLTNGRDIPEIDTRHYDDTGLSL